MKLLDIVKTIGTGIIREAVPSGGLIIDIVNSFLPDDKKLPGNASGAQVEEAVASLPPEQRARIQEKEIDVDLTLIKERHSTVRAMLEADYKNPQTTRPYIAKGAFLVIAACTLAVVATWCGGVWLNRPEIVNAAAESGDMLFYLLGPLVTLLWAYFGILKQEHSKRLDTASGSPSQPKSLLSALFNREK
jgi:hypothetical protein